MKKLILKYISVLGLCVAMAMPATQSYAQYLQHTPTTKVVEFSLQSLRESAQEIADYNQQLKLEISTLRQKIVDIRKESQFFENQQNQIDDALSNFFKDKNTSAKQHKLSEDELKRVTQKLAYLDQEYETLRAKAIAKQEQGKAIHKDFVEVKKEIEQMRHDLEHYGYLKSSSNQDSEQMDMLYALKESISLVTELSQTYQKMAHVQDQDGSHEELLARKKDLQKQIEAYKKENELALLEKRELEDILTQTKEKYTDQIAAIKTENEQLTERKQKLEETLAEARKQLKEKDVDLVKLKEQAAHIQQNIDLIEQQNDILVQDYDSLLPRK